VSASPQRIRVWDLPTRIFHWSLVALVVFSFVTGNIGGDWMKWHLRSGYTVLTLVSFRILWGLFGSETARFAHFVRGARAGLAYARATLARNHPTIVGHNPLGGWMVVLMLAALVLQTATGLFSDDEIATQGPLAVKVSNAMVSRMSALHAINQWVLVVLAALHVIAILVYRLKWDVPLVAAMIDGNMEAPPGTAEPRHRPAWLAVVLLAVCIAAVYALVVVYPMR